tara:strand:+ start:161 stop:571 length:411 start_codon:yes stop_codon:yes gene_type:complete
LNKIFILFLIFFSFQSYSLESFKKTIEIKSGSIEFIDKDSMIKFIDGVEINSEMVNILAIEAIYDDIENTITMIGNPSEIQSLKESNIFKGYANKIIFYDDNKIELFGNAYIKYENLSITSNSIVFNPITGKISSE